MKNQALFFQKIKVKKLKCHLLQFLFGALKVKLNYFSPLNEILTLKSFSKSQGKISLFL